MQRSVPSALIVLLITAAAILSAARNTTDPAVGSPLLSLTQLARQAYTPPLRGWSNSSLDPCGSHANCGIMPAAALAQTQPNTSIPSCAWEGITCRNWRVVALDLPCSQQLGCMNPYVGQLPQSLGNLTALEYLSLSGHQLTGSLPAAPDWPSLTVLDLHGNSITGTLPPQWGTKLKQVVQLDLGDNQLSGKLPEQWGQLKNLQHLDLGGNNLSGSIPSSWAGMTSLSELLLDNNCLLCGEVPFTTITGRQAAWSVPDNERVMVTMYNTSLGNICGLSSNPCSSASSYDVQAPIIAVSVVLVSLILWLLYQSYRWIHAQPAEDTTTSAPPNPDRPRLGESGGVVKLVRPQKQIPTYQCCVELSAIKLASVTANGIWGANASSSIAHDAAADGAAPAEGITAAGWQYPAAVNAALQPESAVTAPTHSQGSAHKPEASNSTSTSVQQAHNMLRRPLPTVILMPDKRHLVLAVPDIPPPQDCDVASSSGRNNSGRGSSSRDVPLGSDIESGIAAGANTNSGQQVGQARQGAYQRAVSAGQQLRRGMLRLFTSSAQLNNIHAAGSPVLG